MHDILKHGPELSAPPLAPALATRTCVLVAGMHRSGTSAVARVVNLLGADIASELVPAREDNVRGFWEPAAVVEIHDRLLHGLGSYSADPLPLPGDWLGSAPARRAQDEIAAFLDAEFAASRLFVVKDPRIARLLPLWLRLLDAMGLRTVVVIPFRHPLEVAASLCRRDRFPLAPALLLYGDSYLQAELASRSRPRCFVGFERLLDDWRPFERDLRRLLGAPQLQPRRAAAIDAFLSPSLRHHRAGDEEQARLAETSRLARDVFDLLNRSASGDAARLRDAFDALRRSVEEAAFLFRGVVLEERRKIRLAEEGITAIERSISWRLTAPLRWARRTVTTGRAI